MFPVQSSEVSGVRNLHSMTPIISFINDRGIQKVQKVFDRRYARDNLEDNCEDYVDILRVSPVGFKGFGNQVCCGRRITAISHGVRQPGSTFSGKLHILLNEEDISSSLTYFYKKETELLLKFSKPDFLKKIYHRNLFKEVWLMKDRISMSKSQIIDGQRF